MCGIFGVAGDALPDRATFSDALATIAHRGPDASGEMQLPKAILGHRRLTVIDLTDASNQPFNGAQSVLVFNGEIYNFRQLRSELETAGCRFATSGDTEVISQGYETWGLDIFRRLRGMFAVAIYDKRTQEVHLARDPFGIKPLYIRLVPGGLAFASEVKPLLALSAADIEPDTLLDISVWGFQLSQKSFYAGIETLEPGRVLTFKDGVTRTTNFAFRHLRAGAFDPFPYRRIRTVLSASVDDHFIADVPVGIALSGGLDSSIIAALAADRKPTAFTTTFLDHDDADVEHARLLAKHFGLKHELVKVTVCDLESLVLSIARSIEEPIANPNLVPTFALSQVLHNAGYKVVLMGEGSDELFAGYPWHVAVAQNSGDHDSLYAIYRKRRGQSDYRSYLTADAMQAIAKRELTFPETFSRAADGSPGTPLAQMLMFDQTYQLRYSQLHRVDKMMMAHSVEARVPYLYEPVATLAEGLSDSQKIRMRPWQKGRDNKIALARSFRRRLPPAIVDRPKFGAGGTVDLWSTPLFADLDKVGRALLTSSSYRAARDVLARWMDWGAIGTLKLPQKQAFSLAMMVAAVHVHCCDGRAQASRADLASMLSFS